MFVCLFVFHVLNTGRMYNEYSDTTKQVLTNFVKSAISTKKRNQTSGQKSCFSLQKTNGKKIVLNSVGTKLLGEVRSQVLSMQINLR